MDLNQISEHVVIDRRGVGTILHLERKSYTWEKFIFKYQYRDGYKICEQWAEDWTERCVLK
jgi:tRNA splicing ligase